MQEIIATKGQAFGRISALNTLATMEVGETWSTPAESINILTLRTAASRYGLETGKRFSIKAKAGEDISVTRTL